MKAKYISPACKIVGKIGGISIIATSGSSSGPTTVSPQRLQGFGSEDLKGINAATGSGWSSLSKNRFYQGDED